MRSSFDRSELSSKSIDGFLDFGGDDFSRWTRDQDLSLAFSSTRGDYVEVHLLADRYPWVSKDSNMIFQYRPHAFVDIRVCHEFIWIVWFGEFIY